MADMANPRGGHTAGAQKSDGRTGADPFTVARPAPRRTTLDLADLAEQLRALLADLDGQAREVAGAYRDGYRDGYATGYDLGRAHAEQEMAEQWRQLAAMVRAHGRTRAHAEQERVRWGGCRKDFGKPRPGDFPGRMKGAA
ncbi:hypothetical protein ACWDUI_29425 [Streptosporangium sandarakinum]